ncbi:MAG TPA: MgtC/SapB family protein [Phycisphaerales bacterium]|nr:MgtC/SapB family protein [Phycisphaerales bacterium]
MDLIPVCTDLGIALALGLLVGLQRERSASAVAGIRTFAFITLLGALLPIIATLTQVAWAVPASIVAGLLAVLGLAYIGNITRDPKDPAPGVTTEVAMLVMFAAGVLCGLGESRLAAIVGAATAVLLHLKPSLQRFTRALTDEDVRAIMQFAAISLIILPVVPDRDMGPFNAFNPRHMWLLVVLVVGISLAAYVAYRIRGDRQGIMLAGVLGGLISSTATTAAFARRVREQPASAALGASAIILASTVVYARVIVELYAVARTALPMLLWPLLTLFGIAAATAVIAAALATRDGHTPLPPPRNPSELKSALVFAGMFGIIQLLTAAANHWLGGRGHYAVAAVSGLTDLDAITLSSGRLLTQGQVTIQQAGAAIVIALASNLVFKVGLAGVLGGPALLKRLWWAALVNVAACGAVLLWWVPRLATP